MANICTNQVVMTNEAFKKIAPLFKQPENDYEKPYLDFERIIPLPEGACANNHWGVVCRPYNTEIIQDKKENGFTTITFSTHWNAPHPVLETLVRQNKIELEAFSFEPGCHYTCIAKYEFEDGFNPHSDDVNDFLMIEMDKEDIDDTCLKIFGITFDEYNRGAEDNESEKFIAL